MLTFELESSGLELRLGEFFDAKVLQIMKENILENKEEFKDGDRVICVKEYDHNYEIIGKTGTVKVGGFDVVLVSYDVKVNGHESEGCPLHRGWWTSKTCLRHIEY